MKPSLKRFAFKAMGSHCEIQLFDESRVYAKRLAKKLADEAHRLEKKYSRFSNESYLAQINATAGDKLGIKIDTETKLLFEHAHSCFKESDGKFDITAGALAQIWDFKKAIVPEPQEIEEALSRVGFENLSWSKSRLYMPAGMEIDFGGIVKEYAADALASLAIKLGCTSGLINLGGDFAVIGPPLESEAWPVGIVHPEKPQSVMATLQLREGGLASSGDYERFFFHEGIRYSHMLDPKTGWPCKGLRAVSVASSLCTVAGSIATIAMLKDEDEAVQWLKDTGVPHVYMNQEGVIGGPSAS